MGDKSVAKAEDYDVVVGGGEVDEEKKTFMIDRIISGDWKAVVALHKRHPNIGNAPLNTCLQTALHIAVSQERADVVKNLLKHVNGDTLKAIDVNTDTPFHSAAKMGMIRIFNKMACISPQLIHQSNSHGETPYILITKFLHDCTYLGRHWDAVEYAYKKIPCITSAKIAVQPHGTALHIAISLDMIDIAKRLLRHVKDGEFLLLLDSVGENPLHKVVPPKRLPESEFRMLGLWEDMVRMSPKMVEQKNENGQTPISLLNYYMDKMSRLNRWEYVLAAYEKIPAVRELIPTVMGRMLIEKAIYDGREDVAKKLLTYVGDEEWFKAKDEFGRNTLVHAAAENGMIELCSEMVRISPQLLHFFNNQQIPLITTTELVQARIRKEEWDAAMDVFAKIFAFKRFETKASIQTPLHLALSCNKADVAKRLMSRCRTDRLYIEYLQDENGNTALHLMAAMGMMDLCLEFFNDYDFNTLATLQNNKGETPLFHFSNMIRQSAIGGNWKVVTDAYGKIPFVRELKLTSSDQTALHMAVSDGRADIAMTMLAHINRKSRGNLRIEDKNGDTALHVAAEKGMIDVCTKMFSLYPELISSRNNKGESPLFGASSLEMMLVFHGRPNSLDAEGYSDLGRRNDGNTILHFAIAKEDFQLALFIIQKYPALAKEPSTNEEGETPLHIFAGKASAFRSREPLGTFEHIVYSWLNVKDGFSMGKRGCLGDTENPVNVSDLSRAAIVKMIENKKQKHFMACEIVEELMSVDSWNKYGATRELLGHENFASSTKINPYGETPLLIASRTGVIEIVKAILKKFPHAIFDRRTFDNKNAVLLAVENRHADVYELLLSVVSKREHAVQKHILEIEDINQENALHLVAKLSSHRPWRMPGETMQMHWEIKWYKYVRDNMPPHFSQARNKEGKTPRDVFDETHKNQIKSLEGGGEWLNKTSQSCSVVASLIATVAFAAATTFPGGDNDEGAPNFLGKWAFSTFVISTFTALCLSLTSLIMFLTILISPFEDSDDFGRSLPEKLITGLTTLLLSIGTILISFWAAHFFFLKGRLIAVALPIYIIACMPITKVVIAQIPFYTNLLSSVYRAKPRPWYRQIYV